MIQTYFIILGAAIALNLLVIFAGSYIANKYETSFGFFSILSLIIYARAGYMASLLIAPIAGISLLAIIGLIEATLIFKLMVKLGANIDIEELNADMDEMEMVDDNYNLHPGAVVVIMFLYMILGWLSSLFV